MWQSIEVHFDNCHPTAAGHFPANPIIPGALLLDEIVSAISGAVDHVSEIVIWSAKFFRPVRPGESVSIQWRFVGGGLFKFECRGNPEDILVTSGMIEINGKPE